MSKLLSSGEGVFDIELVNASPEDKADIQAFIHRSNAQGGFNFHGKRITYNGVIHCDFSSSIELTSTESDSPLKIIRASKYIPGSTVINTDWFNSLMINKRIADGYYYEELGLIEAYKDTTLTVYLSSSLSDAQWNTLIRLVNQHRVTLTCYAAEHVEFPEFVSSCLDEQTSTSDTSTTSPSIGKLPIVYLSNDIKADNISCSTIIDIDDYGYADLFVAVGSDISGSLISNFSSNLSGVLQALIDGKDVVLRGKFSPVMLSYIHPILANGQCLVNGELMPLRGQLRLVVEYDDANTPLESMQQSLSWLPADQLVICEHPVKNPEPRVHAYTESDSDSDSSDSSVDREHEVFSIKLSDAFINARRDNLKKLLNDSTTHGLILVGETGVGKSRLIEEFFNHHDNYHLYHDLDSIDHWLTKAASDTATLHVLFLDESNLQDSNLTLFSNLFDDAIKQEHKKILYQGKLRNVPKNCKVIFACNPESYGAGRVNQALFSRYSIPSMEFCDFPKDTIYHVILKPLISHISEDNLKVCKDLIQRFVDKKPDFITVRALQHEVMKLVFPFTQEERSDAGSVSVDRKYVVTPTSRPIFNDLHQFLSIKRKQVSTPSLGRIGLNGLLIEGEPSCGKSALVEHTLNELYGVQGDTTSVESRAWIKVDASLSLKRLETTLIQAFERGQTVWIDEINSVSSSGIERVLNSLLCGQHPKTGKPANKPGFCVLATANSAALEGRDVLSPALQARFEAIKHPNLTARDTTVILDALIEDVNLKQTIAQLIHYFSDEISLRDIVSKWPQLVEKFGSSSKSDTDFTP